MQNRIGWPLIFSCNPKNWYSHKSILYSAGATTLKLLQFTFTPIRWTLDFILLSSNLQYMLHTKTFVELFLINWYYSVWLVRDSRYHSCLSRRVFAFLEFRMKLRKELEEFLRRISLIRLRIGNWRAFVNVALKPPVS